MTSVRRPSRFELAAATYLQAGLLVAGVGAAGVAATQYDDFAALADQTTKNVARDLSVGSLKIVDATGFAGAAGIEELVLSVRVGGTSTEYWLNDTAVSLQTTDAVYHSVIAADGERSVTFRGILDRDGSLQSGLLNEGDLAELHMPVAKFAKPLPWGAEFELTFISETKAEIHATLVPPDHKPAGRLVEIEVQQRL